MENSELKISIILPIYKVEKYINQCLESIKNQTYNNLEIILVDDGSPDECGHICDDFARDRDDTLVLHCKNAGVSVARNIGIEHATGEYILFVDPDDWLEFNCCEQLINFAKDTDYDVVFFLDKGFNDSNGTFEERSHHSSFALGEEDLRKLRYSVIGMNYRAFGFHCGTPWGKLFKREFIEQHHLRFTPDVVKAQDVLFDTQVYEVLDNAYYLDFTGYVYRLNEGNEGSSNIRYNPKIVKATILLIEGIAEVADMHVDDREYELAMGNLVVSRINFMERLYIFHKDCNLQKNETINIYKQYLSLPCVKKYMRFYNYRMASNIKDKLRFFLLKNGAISIYYNLMSIRYLGIKKS